MRISLLLLFCFAMGYCTAQKYVFINYGVDEGLAHSQVRALHQDTRGALWVGTLGGLSKFDGNQFINYSIADGLFNNHINAIAECSDDSLVFGMTGGISFYDGRKFRSYSFPKEFGSANINQFLTSEDSVLIATEKGLASFKAGKVRFHTSQFKFASQNIKSLIKHESGIYILTRSGLYDWNYDGLDHLINSEDLDRDLDLNNTRFTGMVKDENGVIFISTLSTGLIEYSEGKIELLTGSDGLVSDLLSGIYLDNSDSLMVYGKLGISHLKGTGIINLSLANGLENTDVRAVIQDKQGNYWIGTNSGGLFRFTGYAFTYYTTEEGLSSDVVMTIQRKNENHLSLGSFENGVSQFENGMWNYLTFPNIANNRVWTSIVDSQERIWYGTSGGISIVQNEEVLEHITVESGLDYKKVTALFEDSNGTIWIGTSRGLNKLENGSISVIEEFLGDRVRFITEDDHGTIFIASRQGVWTKTGETYELLPMTEGLEDPLVYALATRGNNLWAGTKEGLFLMRSDSILQVKLSSNYSSNIVNFLEYDGSGKLWVGTNYGLFCVNEDLSIDSFNKQDGLINLETNLNAAYSDEEGLWFGTSYALQHLNFDELEKSQNNSPPEVVLTNVKLNLEETDWGKLKSKYFIAGSSVPVSPEVSYKNNNFSFSFTTNTLDTPENLRYQYMVEGFDESWQPITDNPSATYTNLPYKDFVLKVRAKRMNQAWGQSIRYPFSIRPPFWQTWWFILLSAIAVSYIAFAVFQYRRRNLITSLEKEKFELRSKMLSLEQQSLNSSMNRHFIFNALNSIQYYINRQDRLSANRYLSNFAKLIRKNLDSSQVNFTSLADELERLELYLEIENMRFKDKFDYTINVADNIDEEVIQIPSMLLQPYLENSIWHGILPQEKQGEISIMIEKNSLGQMEIRIKDNGIGINTSQALKNGKATHISKGMDITSGRIELLERLTDEKVILLGPLELKDENDNVLGTQVTIKLPLEYNEAVMH